MWVQLPLPQLLSPVRRNKKERSEFTIFKITRNEADMLRNNGYDEFVKVSSKTHKSRCKRYWIVEDRYVLRYLNRYRNETIAK